MHRPNLPPPLPLPPPSYFVVAALLASTRPLPEAITRTAVSLLTHPPTRPTAVSLLTTKPLAPRTPPYPSTHIIRPASPIAQQLRQHRLVHFQKLQLFPIQPRPSPSPASPSASCARLLLQERQQRITARQLDVVTDGHVAQAVRHGATARMDPRGRR
ncbi:unnamed protein product [Closterium sp. NIES-54]